MDSVIHDFAERLEWSAALSEEPSWIAFYRRLWPDLISAVRIDKNSAWQKWGVDRLLLLASGRQFTVDEKKREKDYGDLLIEEWSVGRRIGERFIGEKVGWSLDATKRCDFIAYAIPPAGKCYMLPFELLRQACSANLEVWKQLVTNGRPAYPKDARNNGYVTRNCAVPWPEVKRAICEQMLRRFGTSDALTLPVAESNGDAAQQVFHWAKQ